LQLALLASEADILGNQVQLAERFMSSKRAAICFSGATGLVILAVTCGLLLGQESKPADSESAVTVPAFGGDKQPLSETVQVLVLGPRNTTIRALHGDGILDLPGYLNLPADGKAVQFRFVVDGRLLGDGKIIGTLASLVRDADAETFVKEHAISLKLSESDIRSAENGQINKFVILPHRDPTEKWAGHFGTLDQPGLINKGQRDQVLRNLKERGHLLAELVIAKQE
jgi:hypothetical protein